jgi:hypothetical protein
MQDDTVENERSEGLGEGPSKEGTTTMTEGFNKALTLINPMSAD